MILVSGATGNIGKGLVGDLVAKGARVRVLVRDPSKAPSGTDVAKGDLDDAGSVAAALAGTDVAFMLCATPQQEAIFLDAAKRANVRRIVMLSSGGVPFGVGGGPGHAAGEDALRASSFAWTILRPWELMSNALRWADTIRAQGAVYEPAGEGKTALVDPRDVGAVAAKVLTSDGHEGKTYELTGPSPIGRAEMVAALAARLGKPIRYVDLPEPAFEDQMSKFGVPPFLMKPVLGFYRMVREGKLDAVYPDTAFLLGRKARAFEDWAADHAAAFA